jgi:hypothetical protein
MWRVVTGFHPRSLASSPAIHSTDYAFRYHLNPFLCTAHNYFYLSIFILFFLENEIEFWPLRNVYNISKLLESINVTC